MKQFGPKQILPDNLLELEEKNMKVKQISGESELKWLQGWKSGKAGSQLNWDLSFSRSWPFLNCKAGRAGLEKSS